MAQRRMFSDKIIDSDAFLDMPQTTQNLYFHLCMRADDDGFISSPKKITKMIGASEDDYKVLVVKRFVIPFDTGVCVIKHWRIHNLIRQDRYSETVYLEEKSKLSLKNNGSYTLATRWQPDGNQLATQDRLGKDRLGEESIDISTDGSSSKLVFGEFGLVKLSDEEYKKLTERFGEKNTKLLITQLDSYMASKGKRYKSHYATILTWANKKFSEHQEKLQTSSKRIA